jgi:Zn-dependent protease with chaperone function
MYSTDAYRYPNEMLILASTLLLVLVVIGVTATATLCGSVLFVGLAVLLAYSATRSHHANLMRQAYPVQPETTPELAALAQRCIERLQPGRVQVFVANSRQLNAYTFGMDDPKVVVLYAGLLSVMDADELAFIIGHELGHVRLGHTRLNSILGGLAGIPAASPVTALLTLAFLAWNRACEHSADRAGLLACGKPDKAITALVKLVAGPRALSRAGLERAYQQIDAQDDHWLSGLGEVLGTHPMIIKRIQEMRRYAKSEQYQRLLGRVAQNNG